MAVFLRLIYGCTAWAQFSIQSNFLYFFQPTVPNRYGSYGAANSLTYRKDTTAGAA